MLKTPKMRNVEKKLDAFSKMVVYDLTKNVSGLFTSKICLENIIVGSLEGNQKYI